MINPERRTHCVRIEARDGDVVRIAVGYPVDIVMGNGSVYLGGLYGTTSSSSATTEGGAAVLDLGSVYSADTITQQQVAAQKWDGASVYSFYCDWAAPEEDAEPDKLFTLGKIREQDGRYTVEMMSQSDMLNKTQGRSCTPGCGWVFGDSHVDGTLIASDKSRCKIIPVFHQFAGSVTAVNGNQITVSLVFSGEHADDYFAYGEITFTGGQNIGAGYRLVKSSTAAGVITLAQGFYYPILVGDEFVIRAGCRKRYEEDCIQKFGNAKNFGGFPSVPQKSAVLKFGDQ